MNKEWSPEVASQFPLTTEMVKQLRDSAPMVMNSPIDWLLQNGGHYFPERAERLIALAKAIHPDPGAALVEYTVGYMMEQARFLQSGKYAFTDFEQARAAVYDNEEVMSGFYLAGLLLTHAFWPVHYVMHNWFLEQFVERVGPSSQGVEIGFGHGLYLAEILQRHPDSSVEGYDISQHSLAFASKLLAEFGFDQSRWRLQLGDVRNGFTNEGPFDWGIFAEVLEHIPQPDEALAGIADILKPGGLLYAVTVVDSNAIDHLYHFRSSDEVLEMFRNCGLEVVDHLLSSVAEYSHDSDPTVNVSVICQKVG